MAELERELRSLATAVEWPPTPQLEVRLEPRRRRSTRLLAVVLVAIAVAIAVAFSVPAARSAILRLFHLGGVTVEQVVVLPPAQERALAVGLGRRVDEKTAAATLGARVRLPALAGQARLHLSEGVVSTVISAPQPVLLSEFRSGAQSYVLKKIAGASTDIVAVQVGRAPGLWIAGARHLLLLPAAPPRLAGNVLLWQSGEITYRLEGRNLSEQLALRLATQIEGT